MSNLDSKLKEILHNTNLPKFLDSANQEIVDRSEEITINKIKEAFKESGVIIQ